MILNWECEALLGSYPLEQCSLRCTKYKLTWNGREVEITGGTYSTITTISLLSTLSRDSKRRSLEHLRLQWQLSGYPFYIRLHDIWTETVHNLSNLPITLPFYPFHRNLGFWHYFRIRGLGVEAFRHIRRPDVSKEKEKSTGSSSGSRFAWSEIRKLNPIIRSDQYVHRQWLRQMDRVGRFTRRGRYAL